MSFQHHIRLALHHKFLESYTKINKKIQKKTREFLKSFKEKATHSSVNYEVITDFDDPQMRTCKIDDQYRIIIRQPEEGSVYLVLWVDNHDEAMQWAKNKVVHFNEHNQAIEIIDIKEIEEHTVTLKKESNNQLFAKYTKDDLLALGINEVYIGFIKLMDTHSNFELMRKSFPPRPYSYLLKLLDPQVSYDEVLKLAQQEAYARITMSDSSDSSSSSSPSSPSSQSHSIAINIDQAIDAPINKEQFFIYTEDEELLWILEKPLQTWRVFLHSSQRKIVETSVKGSVRVLGGAGTGKTVVALHRVKWLLEHGLEADDRILLMTYTSTLKIDLHNHLKSLITDEQSKRVSVQNFDAWLKQFYKKYSHLSIKFWEDSKKESELQKIWKSVLHYAPEGFSSAFLRMEWEQVILGQGITNLSGYLYASRSGRGTPLKKSQRKVCWIFFDAYIQALLSNHMVEREMAMWELVSRALKGELTFPYRSIVLDEVQDMSTASLRLLRVLLPYQDNDLFMVGDGYQKIYSKPISMKQAAIYIQGAPHAHRLRINYRTTDKIHESAMKVVQGQNILDLDGEMHGLKFYESLILGDPPTVSISSAKEKRQSDFLEWLSQKADRNKVCVIARTKNVRTEYADLLSSHGYEVLCLESHLPVDFQAEGIRVATCHRVKGLEFKSVAVVDIDSKYTPPYFQATGDQLYEKQKIQEERSLAYVSMSRARESLFISIIE